MTVTAFCIQGSCVGRDCYLCCFILAHSSPCPPPPAPPPSRTAVHAAAFNDNVECLQLLLKENVEVNAVDAHGRTPLMMAANFGHTNAVGE